MIQEFKDSFSIFKTTDEVKKSTWETFNFIVGQAPAPTTLPDRQYYFHRNDLTFSNVKTWELLYYEPGSLGIYGAWNPYAEFFIIVHNLFVDVPGGIEVFSGEHSMRNLFNRAKELGILLPTGRIWVEEENKHLYDHFN